MRERSVDYELVASVYDRRYEISHPFGVASTLADFVGSVASPRVIEVGCGTGYWLELLANRGGFIIGMDPAGAMLERARSRAPAVTLVRGRAEALPWQSASFERVFVVNALHHFTDAAKFMSEARRVLRPAGGVLIVGLDPHAGMDKWWVYDYFPETLEIDNARFPSAGELRSMMASAGFSRCETKESHHFRGELSLPTAREAGMLDRRWTSQLAALTVDEYQQGRDRIERDADVVRVDDEQVTLTVDLRLYATTGWVP